MKNHREATTEEILKDQAFNIKYGFSKHKKEA